MAVLDRIEGVPALQRWGVVLLILLGLGAGFFYLVQKPRSARITGLESRLATLNNELQDLRAINKKLPEFKELIADLERQLDEARQQLPRDKEIPGLLDAISRFGRESGMEFISFRPGGEAEKGFYNEVPVSLAITGPFHNLVTFLNKISNYPRIIQVSNLSIGDPKPKEGLLMLRSTCLATTYRYVETK